MCICVDAAMNGQFAKTSFWMSVNFISCVWIIWATKICFQHGFKYGTFLTAFHFLLTYIGLEVSAVCHFFERRRLPILGVLPLSIAFCGFIVFNNLSLEYNTIGIYQVTKVLTTPVIVLINIVFYKKWLSFGETWALIFVCAGVIVATEANLELNTAGIVTGLLGVLSSSIYQVWVETKQHDFACSPAQLLYYQAPISLLLLLPVIALTEPFSEIVRFTYTPVICASILGSGILAFLVNLSTYMVIGSTSPLTYNMIGHSKLVIIILSSFLVFHEKQSWIGLVGVASAVIGIVAYAQIRMLNVVTTEKPTEYELCEEQKPLIDALDSDTTADDV